MEKYPTVIKILEEDGWTIEKEDMIRNHQKRTSTKGVHHNRYKEPAIEMVLNTFKGNEDITLTMGQIQKALSASMPMGTISGSLAKLQKAGKIEHAGAKRSGKWKLK